MSTEKNTAVDIINTIERMMFAAGCKSESQLMEFIGNKRGASTRWKDRKKIPEKAVDLVVLKTEFKKKWIETGEGPMREEPPERLPMVNESLPNYYSATTHKIAQMVEAMDEEARKDICLSVEKEKLLRELLRQRESDEKAS